MNRVALDLGFIQIYWYSICILVGLIIGMFLVYRETIKKGIGETLITNLIFYTVIVAILGARLYYIIFDWNYYSKNPVEMLEIWNGGLAIHGAIILGGLFLITYTKQHKMDTLKVLDICSVGLIIGQAIGRWGNFFNQEVFGQEVSLDFLQGLHLPGFIINGMHINGHYYQPLFLYESLWCLLGFLILLFIRRRKYIKTGQIFGIYCMWYSVGRFFLEGMRDSKYNLMIGDLKVAQIVSIGMFVVGLFFFIRRIRTSRFEHLYNDEGIVIQKVETQSSTPTKETTKKSGFFSGSTAPIAHSEPEPKQEPVTESAPTMNSAPTINNAPTMNGAPTLNNQQTNDNILSNQNNT